MARDFTEMQDWVTEITRRANAPRYLAQRVGGLALLAVLLLAVILGSAAALSATGTVQIGGLVLTREAITLLAIVAGMIDVLIGAQLVADLRAWLAPAPTRYSRAALAIIAELVEPYGRITPAQALPLRNEAQRLRSAATLDADQVQPFLDDVCSELARQMRTYTAAP